MTKPVELDAFNGMIKSLGDFWVTQAKLAQRDD